VCATRLDRQGRDDQVRYVVRPHGLDHQLPIDEPRAATRQQVGIADVRVTVQQRSRFGIQELLHFP
jgi:hypothetical protein